MPTVSSKPVLPDEVDLRQVATTLWSRKLHIFSVGAGFAIIAAAYALVTPATYESAAVLLPPPASELVQFNADAGQLGLGPGTWAQPPKGSDTRPQNQGLVLSSADAHQLFISYLSASSTQRKFADQIGAFEGGTNAALPHIKIVTPKNTVDHSVTITLQGKRADLLQRWTNEYISLAARITQAELNAGLENARQAKINILTQSAVLLRRADTAIATRESAILQAQLKQLHATPAPALNLQVFTMDAAPASPLAPIKPRKPLIITLGAVLGLMFGTFWALVRRSFAQPRANTLPASPSASPSHVTDALAY